MKSKLYTRLYLGLSVITLALSAPSAYSETVTYNTAGTTSWLCPPGVTTIEVECWGGGGAGGSGNKTVNTATNTSQNGGGGGGGAYAKKVAVPVTPGLSYTITIPSAALSVTSATNNTLSGSGGTVSFVGDAAVTVSAAGGVGGRNAWTNVNSTVAVAGGAGGSAVVGDPGATFSGGTGTASTTGATNYSGGGGGGAGNASAGSAASTKFGGAGGSVGGGAGGDGRGDGNVNEGLGGNGATPGGGGGGGKNLGLGSNLGGTGGLGQITITYTPPPADPIVKANNTDDLNLTTSWVGGVVPVSNNFAVWDDTVTSANTTVLAANASWAGIKIEDPAGLVTINAGNALTLTGFGLDTEIDMSTATQDLDLNCNIVLGTSSTWDVASGRTLSLDGAISGASLVTKQGAGTAILTNTNTYIGNTFINGGVVDVSTDGAQLYNSASTINAVVTVTNGGVLILKNYGQASTSGIGSPSLGNLNNTGGQVILDGGTLRFNGENAARGRKTNIGAGGGTIDVVNSSAFTLNSTGSFIFSGPNVLTLTGDATSSGTIEGVIAGTGVSIVKNGDATWNLTGANTHTGGVTVNASSGTLSANISSAPLNSLGSGAVSVGTGSTLILNNTSTGSGVTTTVSNAFTGTGLLKVQFSANANGKNTQLPNISGFNGTIQLSPLGASGDKWNATNLGTLTSPLIVDSGATLYLPSGTTSFSSGITLSGTGNTENRGVIRLSNAILNGNIALAGSATINLDNAAALLTGNISSGVAAPATLTLGATASTGGRLSGIIGGGTDVINLATAVGGTYTLTNANTYTGTTVIAASTALQLGNGTAGNDGSIATTSGVTNDGTLIFNRFSSDSIAYPISGTGALIKSGPGALTLSGLTSYSGATTVNAGTLTLDYSTEDNSKLSDTAVLTLGAATLNLSGGTHTEIVASTTLVANTASTVTSSGSAILQMGPITANTGASINFGAPGIATTDTLNNVDGILGYWATVNGSDFAINSTNGTNGPITSYGSYTDVPRLNGASQVIADNSASFVRIIEGTGTPANITLAAATTSMKTLSQSNSGGVSAAIINPAGQTLATEVILAASGVGSLTIGNGINNGSLQALTSGGNLLINALGSNSVVINSSVIDNTTSSLSKIGSGSVVLNGANTYAGGTTLSEGSLRLGNAGALGTGTLTITGGSLDSDVVNLVNSNNNAQAWNGNFTFVGSQNLDLGTGPVTLGVTPLVTVNANTLKVGGVISGAFGITKVGAGTMELSGENAYSGVTTVREGTLILSGGRSVASGMISASDAAGLSATLNITGGTYSIATQMNVGNAPSSPATGTVNQSGGAVVFTASNQLLVGQNTVGNTGIYNLSAGSLTTNTSTTRGVMIGVNANATGVFNLSGTGALNMTAASGGNGDATLLITRHDAATDNVNATFNQTGGTANVGILSMGGNGATGIGLTSTLNVTAGVFAANQFARLAAGNTNTATINIGGTADVTLPAFPTARGTGSTATINFDGGTLRPSAASATYMGGLTAAFIKAGGAKFDTGFDITVAQNLLTDTLSTGGGLTKEGASALALSGANTYTGVTNVNAGTLTIANAAALGTTDGNTVVASGAKIFAGAAVASQTVAEAITLAGTGGGSGALQFGGGVTGLNMSGAITLTADALIKNDGSTNTTISGGLNISDKVLTFTSDGGATNSISTVGIGGTTGSVVKTGGGTLALSAAGTYSGGTTNIGGVINVNHSSALGSGSAVLDGGNRYVIGDGVNVANAFTLGANVGVAGFGLIHVATETTGTVSGPINITTGATAGGHFASGGTGVLNLTGPITSSVNVSNRAGTIVHSGGGTGYTLTNIGQGTVRLGANDGIATTATMTVGSSAAAIFDLAGFNQTMVGITKGGSAATIGNSSETTDSILTLTGTSTYAGVIQDVIGAGTMKVNLIVNGGTTTLTGANTYTGTTLVSAGTLALVGGSTASPVTVSAGASLSFDIASPTTSTSTFNLTAGTIKITGTPTLNSYDLITTSAGITGTPVLDAPITGYELKVEGNSLKLVKAGYASWAAINAIGSAANLDKDGDGVNNAVEYVLGGDVNTNDLSKLPQSTISGTNLIFTFQRKVDSIDGSTVVKIEVGTNLSTWPTVYTVGADTAGSTAGVVVTEDSSPGFDTITLTVPMGTDVTKFARLAVEVP